MMEDIMELGIGTYAASPIRAIFEHGNIFIGKFCSIASNVTIFGGGEHNYNWVTTYPFNFMCWGYEPGDFAHPKTKGDVHIGSDVWIGENVIILSGVTIGDGCVIGTGAVVAKNIEPYSIVGGNPCVVLKKRFTEDIIEELLKIKWWDWEQDEIRKAIPYLMCDDIRGFIHYCEREGKI